ncbi:hypothetical protein GGTG_11954 [Gaeumannomyces tritici R3-111a-1]|uniref:THIF-type NAD/FAD binding fold domain-containing protein n=1 Tax=Gaeumannomyces tritici (strain R3-111a-1) TaxID=644352 RepID=J3PEM3_GAET3|nr:hypothetical protein GGTG_11954 [Gaeumannomyces tritici R3-111a-1]EJT70931.1 hypothetical protein GGTG_11954 [Gaeumannomyces tritici R3-111a-1]
MSDSKFQLIATALASGVAAASVVLGYQQERQGAVQEPTADRLWRDPPPNADKEDLRNAALAKRALSGDYDEDLVREQLARNGAFLGADGLSRLRGAFVVVVGCGGVGSHCATSLARSGLGRLRLVDFDNVSLSSLNRHAVATLADVGTQKTACLRRRLVAIAPWVDFDLCTEKFDAAAAPYLLGPWAAEGEGGTAAAAAAAAAGPKPDFVVDAIDNIDTKVELLRYCHEHKIPVVSSMGAGCKSDPTKVMVGDIGASTDDPLSRATRRRLKLLGITSGIPVVFSTEKAGEGKAELLPLPDEEYHKGTPGDLGVLPDFRVRILPVLGTMPAVFGYTAANHVMLSITGYPTDYAPAKARDKLYDQVLAGLQASETKLVRHRNGGGAEVAVGLKTPIAAGDIAFLVEEVWGGRSAVTGISTRLNLVRWRRPRENPLIVIGGEGEEEEEEEKEGEGGEKLQVQKSTRLPLGELVCVTKEEAAVHMREVVLGEKEPEELYDAEVIERVERKLKVAASYEKYR